MDSSTPEVRIVSVEKIPVYVEKVINVIEKYKEIKVVQAPASDTEEKFKELATVEEDYGKCYTKSSTEPDDGLIPEVLPGTNTLVPPNRDVGDLSNCELKPEDVKVIVETYVTTLVKTGIPPEKAPPGVNWIASKEPTCWKLIRQFREKTGLYPWEIQFDPEIAEDWIDFMSGRAAIAGIDDATRVEIAKCAGREKSDWTKAFRVMFGLAKNILDAVVNLPNPEPIIQAIVNCIRQPDYCTDESDDTDTDKAKDPWSDKPVTQKPDFSKAIERFSKYFMRTYINRRYSSGVIARWYCGILVENPPGEFATIFKVPEEGKPCPKKTCIIRRVYTRIDDASTVTYNDHQFYSAIKKPIPADDVTVDEEPSTVVFLNKKQLIRVVKDSPWVSEVDPLLSQFEQAKAVASKLTNTELSDLVRHLFGQVDWSTEQVNAIFLLSGFLEKSHSPERDAVLRRARDTYLLRDPQPVLHHFLWRQDFPGRYERSLLPMYRMSSTDISKFHFEGFGTITPDNSEAYWVHNYITKPKIAFEFQVKRDYVNIQVAQGVFHLTDEFMASPFYVHPGRFKRFYEIKHVKYKLFCTFGSRGYKQWIPSVLK